MTAALSNANVPAWEDGRWLPLPSLEGEQEADACVVGLGGSGLACALELLSLGRTVVGIDAGRVGGAAAGRNGGFLLAGLAAFHHEACDRLGRDRARRLYALTLEEIDRIERETPTAVRRLGSLRIADSQEEEEDCRHQLEALRRDGFAAQWYEGTEGTGLLLGSDGAFDPLRRCRELAVQARHLGARLFECSAALEIAEGAVRTAGGRVRCRDVIVAVDGKLERLLPELAPRVRTARLQMIGTAPTDEISVMRPVYARWGLDYWQQLPDHRVVLGGFRDAGGDAEWTEDDAPTPVVQLALEQHLRARLGVHAAITHRWAASVAYSRGVLPVCTEVRPRIWAIGAYSGTGNVVGALCGRAVARQAVLGHDPVAAMLAPE